MLVTNQHLDKLAAAHADFASCGMLNDTCLAAEIETLRQLEFYQLSILMCANNLC